MGLEEEPAEAHGCTLEAKGGAIWLFLPLPSLGCASQGPPTLLPEMRKSEARFSGKSSVSLTPGRLVASSQLGSSP